MYSTRQARVAERVGRAEERQQPGRGQHAVSVERREVIEPNLRDERHRTPLGARPGRVMRQIGASAEPAFSQRQVRLAVAFTLWELAAPAQDPAVVCQGGARRDRSNLPRERRLGRRGTADQSAVAERAFVVPAPGEHRAAVGQDEAATPAGRQRTDADGVQADDRRRLCGVCVVVDAQGRSASSPHASTCSSRVSTRAWVAAGRDRANLRTQLELSR